MAEAASGWARLGDALGGDSELEYQKGLNLGATTENALAQASERRGKAKAQSEAEESFVALGIPRSQARAMSVTQQAGGSFKDVGDILAKEQERGFRDDAAGVTGLDVATGNRRLMGVASGPVDRFQKVGNGVDDRFDEAGVQALPGGAQEGGGSSAAIQIMRAFGVLDENGNVRPGMEERAFDIARSTQSNVQVGEVPGTVNANPYHNKGAAPQVQLATDVGTVAGNKGEVARQTEIGQAAGKANVALPDQLSEISKLRDSISGLLASKGFSGVYGNVQGQPGIRTLAGLVDPDVQDAQIRLKNVDAQTFGVAVQKMIGLGNMSNIEGARVTDAYTRASDPRNSEEAAREAWGEALDGLELAEIKAKRKAQVSTVPGQHNDVKPPQPSGAPPPATPITPQSFATLEAAEAANLPPGTKIMVGGRPATVQ